jgi:hypothetical protein
MVGIPIRAPSITREAFAHIHRRAEIPQRTLDLMADILFDKRDEDPESKLLTGREAMTERQTPLTLKMGQGEILERAAEFRRATSHADGVYAVEADVLQLMQGAVARIPQGRQAFYMSRRTYNYIASLRARLRRTKRRTRYNRGRQGVRPRMRCGR